MKIVFRIKVSKIEVCVSFCRLCLGNEVCDKAITDGVPGVLKVALAPKGGMPEFPPEMRDFTVKLRHKIRGVKSSKFSFFIFFYVPCHSLCVCKREQLF